MPMKGVHKKVEMSNILKVVERVSKKRGVTYARMNPVLEEVIV